MTAAIKEILNKHFEISQNKLLQWRNRYSKQEYPGKVALNLHYGKAKGGAYLPLVAASFGLDHFIANGQQEYEALKQLFVNSILQHGIVDEAGSYPVAYNVIRSFEKNAEQKVIPILEKSIDQLLRIGNPQVVSIQELVSKSDAGNRDALKDLERLYTVEVMTFETFLAWAAWGLMNQEAEEAMDKTIGSGHFLPLVISEYGIMNQFLKINFVNEFVQARLVALPPL